MTGPDRRRSVRPRAVLRFVAPALLVLALLLGAGKAAQEPPPRGSSPLDSERDKVVTLSDVADPHGDPRACAECHALDDQGGVTGPEPTTETCERCHPDTNFHLVGVAPEEVTIPAVMTLQGGEVTCVSCHDEPACDGLARDARGPDHFRDGPYPSTLDLCFRCHERSAYRQTDPHKELRTTDGQRNDAVCVFCHQGVPESEADERVEVLRIDAVELCKGCHAHQIHVGIPSHLVLAPDEMIARVEVYNAEQPYDIPLGPRGEITCSSCHDPHPGLEPLPVATNPRKLEELRVSNRDYRDSYYLPRLQAELETIHDVDGKPLALADGPREKDGLLRVPAEDGTLCLICHEMGGGGP